MRKFDSGATRDEEGGKLNYIKALSPIVMERYVEYLNDHRTQADGKLRDWDNWKKGIPTQVYLESAFRHLMNVWMIYLDFDVSDNHGTVDIEEALCGLIFNAMGYLHEVLPARERVNES